MFFWRALYIRLYVELQNRRLKCLKLPSFACDVFMQEVDAAKRELKAVNAQVARAKLEHSELLAKRKIQLELIVRFACLLCMQGWCELGILLPHSSSMRTQMWIKHIYVDRAPRPWAKAYCSIPSCGSFSCKQFDTMLDCRKCAGANCAELRLLLMAHFGGWHSMGGGYICLRPINSGLSCSDIVCYCLHCLFQNSLPCTQDSCHHWVWQQVRDGVPKPFFADPFKQGISGDSVLILDIPSSSA